MKLLLVNAVDTKNAVELLFPPLGLAYIASYLSREFPSIDIRIVDRDVEATIREYRPDLVGLSAVSQNYLLACEYARMAKSAGVPVVIGGTHISALPQTLAPEMDMGVLGEGEETMAEIIGCLAQGGTSIEHCRTISGIAHHAGDTVVVNAPRPEITDLGKIPVPARNLLSIPRRGIVHLFSSRGCPYNCSFCVSTRYWQKLRLFPAEYVVEEIDRVVRDYDPITIGFYDDLFIASKQRLVEIIERLERRSYSKRIEFVLNGRANLITDEMAVLLKRMNVVAVNLGLESGSEKILQFLKGEATSVEINRKALEVLRRHDINAHGTFIIGAPGETEKDIQQTESFIRSNKLFSFEVYLLTPYPGTPVWEMALERGLVSNDMDWSTLVQEPRGQDQKKVLFTDVVSMETLWKYYYKFQKMSKRNHLISRVETALRHPQRIIPAIRKNLANWFG